MIIARKTNYRLIKSRSGVDAEKLSNLNAIRKIPPGKVYQYNIIENNLNHKSLIELQLYSDKVLRGTHTYIKLSREESDIKPLC